MFNSNSSCFVIVRKQICCFLQLKETGVTKFLPDYVKQKQAMNHCSPQFIENGEKKSTE